MTFKLKSVPAFDRSFDDAVNYLDRIDGSRKARRRFLSEFKVVKDYIAVFPNMYAIREDESHAFGDAIRAVRVENFLAYYVVDEEAEQVVFYFLRHTLSDPEATDWAAFAEE